MTALLTTGTYSTLMCVGITAKQIMLKRAPDFGDPVSSYRGRELFEATPILRPVTSYRAIQCLHVTTLEEPRKARSVSPDCGEETHKEGRHRGRGCGSQSLRYIFSVVWEQILYIDATRSIPGPFFSGRNSEDDNGIDVSRNLQDLETFVCFLLRRRSTKNGYFGRHVDLAWVVTLFCRESRLSSRHCRKRRCAIQISNFTSGEPTIKSTSGCEFHLDTRGK
jgi:hypothetical protein